MATETRHPPSVDKVLRSTGGQSLKQRFGHEQTVQAVRDSLEAARATGSVQTPDDLAASAAVILEQAQASRLVPVYNLTGTVLHTNLGRAQLAGNAIEAAALAMLVPVALEFDVETGGRGDRDDILRDLICELTGAEDATLVNNNAAAVLLVLNTLALGRGAVISRGELIEIGGAFRMPDIMARAGAKMIEVGTTNRTHLRDYQGAIGEDTGLVMKVHTSNYRIEGFKAEVGDRQLADLARTRGVPMVHDLGSGTLIDPARFGLPSEPTVRQAVEAGADIVTFSGDKLLGGPQAGFITGRRDLIAAINANPMKRALRVDKIRLAAIEATLRLYRDPDRLAETLPTYRFLARRADDIRAMAESIAPDVAAAMGQGVEVAVTDCASQVGSGAMPVETLPSAGLAIRSLSGSGAALTELAGALRRLPHPVIGRIAQGALVLDLRCLENEAAFLANLRAFTPPELPA